MSWEPGTPWGPRGHHTSLWVFNVCELIIWAYAASECVGLLCAVVVGSTIVVTLGLCHDVIAWLFTSDQWVPVCPHGAPVCAEMLCVVSVIGMWLLRPATPFILLLCSSSLTKSRCVLSYSMPYMVSMVLCSCVDCGCVMQWPKIFDLCIDQQHTAELLQLA